MIYSKPMVTIELDEYNALLETKKEFDKGLHAGKEDTKPYRKAISAMVNALIGRGLNGNSVEMERYKRIMDSPRTEDVLMTVTNVNGPYYEVHCEMMPNTQ